MKAAERKPRTVKVKPQVASVTDGEPNPDFVPEPDETQDITLKGEGLFHGGINGVPFSVERGKEITVSYAVYSILRDTGEIS